MWLTYRDASSPIISGKLNRTFSIGHDLEETIIGWMEASGFRVHLRQAELTNDFGNRISYIDGVTKVNQEPHLLEIKTASNKSFKNYIKNGLPFGYLFQVQINMHGSIQLSKKNQRLTKALVLMLNKETSELMSWIIEYDSGFAQLQWDRVHDLITQEQMPPARPEEDFVCNMCNHRTNCRKSGIPEVTCGTCAHCSAKEYGLECDLNKTYSNPEQCKSHVFIPDLITMSTGFEVEKYLPDVMGIKYKGGFINAAKPVNIPELVTYTSKELHAMGNHSDLAKNEWIQELKKAITGATVIGSENV
jgi:hypothetical protein